MNANQSVLHVGLQKKLGLENVVMYYMDNLSLGRTKKKVCLSIDFVEGEEMLTFAELVPKAVHLQEQEKYDCIVTALPDYVEQLNKILLFDAIIYNKDR